MDHSGIEVSAEVGDPRSGDVQNGDTVIVNVFTKTVDSGGGPLKGNTGVADDDVAEG